MERVDCDRCGGDTRIASGEPPDQPVSDEFSNTLEGHFFYSGCYGSIKHDYELWSAVLCETCTEAVRDFINLGNGSAKGRGVVVIDDTNEAYATYCQERGLMEDGAVPWTPPDREDWDNWLEERYQVQLPRR